MQVRKQQLELDIKQQTGSKSGKEYVKVVYYHLAYLTYIQSASCEMPGWIKHKLDSRLPGEISITSDMQMTPPLRQKVKRNFLMKVKEESEKSWLKTQHSENKDHGIWSHHFLGNRWGNSGNCQTLFFWGGNSVSLYLGGSKITADGDCSHEIKRHFLLGRKVMTNLDSILKSKVCLVKAIVFPVVMYGCESWTVKKAECRRTDAFELWCWRRLLRVPWTARRSSQSILKKISPGRSLEGLMLKLKVQYFGHLM